MATRTLPDTATETCDPLFATLAARLGEAPLARDDAFSSEELVEAARFVMAAAQQRPAAG